MRGTIATGMDVQQTSVCAEAHELLPAALLVALELIGIVAMDGIVAMEPTGSSCTATALALRAAKCGRCYPLY